MWLLNTLTPKQHVSYFILYSVPEDVLFLTAIVLVFNGQGRRDFEGFGINTKHFWLDWSFFRTSLIALCNRIKQNKIFLWLLLSILVKNGWELCSGFIILKSCQDSFYNLEIITVFTFGSPTRKLTLWEDIKVIS